MIEYIKKDNITYTRISKSVYTHLKDKGESNFDCYDKYKTYICKINQKFNFGLFMDKYNMRLNKKNKVIESYLKSCNKKIAKLNNYSNISTLNKNKEDIIKSFSDTHKNISLELRTLDKLIIGIGDSGVNDYAMTLNHTYGIPYIPASAFKGCLRHYFEGSKLKNLNILLGSNENENASISNIIFLDSYPLNSYNIKMDVITPHTNNNKNPIFFPVVRDTIFKFDILIDKNILKKIKIDEKYKDLKNIDIEKTLEKSIEHMLIDFGIGAKSSSGYGYFRCINK